MSVRGQDIASVIKRQIEEFGGELTMVDVGTVIEAADGVAQIHGLSGVRLNEILQFPGDILGLISDGIYEYENEEGVQFGHDGVARVIDSLPDGSAEEVVAEIMRSVRQHGGSMPQADDITIVLARRSR